MKIKRPTLAASALLVCIYICASPQERSNTVLVLSDDETVPRFFAIFSGSRKNG